MKTKIIHTKVWEDSFFFSLSPSEKLVFLYYITNPNMTITYLYECPDRKIMFDTGLDQETLTNAKNKLQAAGKFHFYKDWVYVANGQRFQDYKGDTNEKAKVAFIGQLPNDVLDWFYNINDTTQRVASGYLKSKSYKKSNPYSVDPEEVPENLSEVLN